MARIQRIAPLTLCGVLLLTQAGAETRAISLQQAASRSGPDLTVVFEGSEVSVLGQVSTKPFWSGDFYSLAIQDAAGYGLILQGARWQFAAYAPGDWIRIRGSIAQHAGMPVLLPFEIQRVKQGPVPVPRKVSVEELNSARYLGVLVSFKGDLTGTTEGNGGDLITVREHGTSINVLVPKSTPGSSLANVHAGDVVQVFGVSAQNCVLPPYDRFYQVVMIEPGLRVISKAWPVAPWLILVTLGSLVGMIALWSLRERVMQSQRDTLRLLNQVGEQVITATTPGDVLQKLNAALNRLSEDIEAALYIHNRGGHSLDMVPGGPDAEPLSVRLEMPLSGVGSGIALCFRNRTLLTIPDTRQSPFFAGEKTGSLPRSAILVPIFGQKELLGVMEVRRFDRRHRFSPDEQAAMQHLANQVGMAFRLQDQKSLRERLFRIEKLAAAGQLISGIAGELQAPLRSIAELSAVLKAQCANSPETGLIESEARRATEIVSRLIAFGESQEIIVQPVELHALLARLLRLRVPECRTKGVELVPRLMKQAVPVLGSQAQLEQAFLDLITYAEQAASQGPDRAVTVTTSLLGRRLVVVIGYCPSPIQNSRPDPLDLEPADGADGTVELGLCRGIVNSHGGDIRFQRISPSQNRFQVELPLIDDQQLEIAAAPQLSVGEPKQLTALLVEPEMKTQKLVLDMLARHGHRVVPVTSAEEAADLALRLRFDLTICSVRLSGLNWVELFERVRRNTGPFVLLTQGYDPDLLQAFQNGEGFVLSKPIDEGQLMRICEAVGERSN